MTRSKAIEILLEVWRYKHSDKYTDKEVREAVDLAIDSLKRDDNLIEKVIESTTELTQNIVRMIPEFLNSGIKCSQCSYYRSTWIYEEQKEGDEK